MSRSVLSKMLTKKILILTHTTLLPNKVIKLYGMEHESE